MRFYKTVLMSLLLIFTLSAAGICTHNSASTPMGEGDLGQCMKPMPSQSDNECSSSPMAHGAPVWSINAQNLNLYIKDVPLWLYLTGVFSAFMILGTTFLIPKVGVRRFFILTVSGQILMAVIVSHFGFLGTPKDPISVKKIIGAVCIVFGVIFSTL